MKKYGKKKSYGKKKGRGKKRSIKKGQRQTKYTIQRGGGRM